jgi:hypothetical protein
MSHQAGFVTVIPIYDRDLIVGRLTELRKILTAEKPLNELELNAGLLLFDVVSTLQLTESESVQILGSYDAGKSTTAYKIL